MADYPIDAHPFAPAGLTGDALREQTELAESVLELRGTRGSVFTDPADLADATRAVALQVALQFAQDPEAFLNESVTRGAETQVYRDGVIVHPTARLIVDRLFASVDSAEGAIVWPQIGGWR